MKLENTRQRNFSKRNEKGFSKGYARREDAQDNKGGERGKNSFTERGVVVKKRILGVLCALGQQKE